MAHFQVMNLELKGGEESCRSHIFGLILDSRDFNVTLPLMSKCNEQMLIEGPQRIRSLFLYQFSLSFLPVKLFRTTLLTAGGWYFPGTKGSFTDKMLV